MILVSRYLVLPSNAATLLFFKVLGLAYGRTDIPTDERMDGHTDSHNQNFLDQRVTKFSKISLMHRNSAIKHNMMC